jgi:hemoglobin
MVRRVEGPTDDSIFSAAGGRDGVRRLAEAWHERCLADAVVAHAFSHGYRPDHVERLAAYWIEQLGGPADYTGAGLGDHSTVVRIHSGNGEHKEVNLRAIACFVAALDDSGFTDDEVRTALTSWFTAMIGDMAAYPDSPDDVPERLPLPRWTWSGRIPV